MMIDIESQQNNNKLLHIIRFFTYVFIIFSAINIHADSKSKYQIKFLGNKGEHFEFEISNNTLDSVFLFSTYICPSYYDSYKEYSILYRYDTIYNQCKLSFLPIITSLEGGIVYGRKNNLTDSKGRVEIKHVHNPTRTYNSWLWNDPFDERIYRYNVNMLKPTSDIVDIYSHYELIAIPPQLSYIVKIHKNAFFNAKAKYKYIQEIYPKTLSILDTLSVVPHEQVECNELLLEFAVYKDIELLLSSISRLFEEYNYNKEALSFEIIAIKVDLNELEL